MTRNFHRFSLMLDVFYRNITELWSLLFTTYDKIQYQFNNLKMNFNLRCTRHFLPYIIISSKRKPEVCFRSLLIETTSYGPQWRGQVILGTIHKLRHTNFRIFYPSSDLVTGDVTYFAILHLEIIKLKQQFRNYFYFYVNYFSMKSTSNQA